MLQVCAQKVLLIEMHYSNVLRCCIKIQAQKSVLATFKSAIYTKI